MIVPPQLKKEILRLLVLQHEISGKIAVDAAFAHLRGAKGKERVALGIQHGAGIKAVQQQMPPNIQCSKIKSVDTVIAKYAMPEEEFLKHATLQENPKYETD